MGERILHELISRLCYSSYYQLVYNKTSTSPTLIQQTVMQIFSRHILENPLSADEDQKLQLPIQFTS